MKRSVFGRHVLLICGAAALLAACGGSQPPIGATGAMPLSLQSSLTDEKGTSYLYVANPGSRSGGEIDIFLPGDPSKGIVDRIRDGVFAPDGIFVDTHSNLYVTNGHISGHESVEMYAKGGHRPIRFYMGALCAFDVIAACPTVRSTSPTLAEDYILGVACWSIRPAKRNRLALSSQVVLHTA